MTQYNIVNPSSLIAGQPEDVSQILANFQAIQSILNGGVDNSNIAVAAGIVASKLAGYPTDSSKFLRGDGVWGTPSGDPLPARLGATSMALPGNDYNQAIGNGWYYAIGPSSPVNGPPASTGWTIVESIDMNGPGNMRQTAWDYNTDTIWMRRRQDNNWLAWFQIWPIAVTPPQIYAQSAGPWRLQVVSSTTGVTGPRAITYPVPFGGLPVIWGAQQSGYGSDTQILTSQTVSGFVFPNGGGSGANFYWMAYGAA
jgi:hypothetical protein